MSKSESIIVYQTNFMMSPNSELEYVCRESQQWLMRNFIYDDLIILNLWRGEKTIY